MGNPLLTGLLETTSKGILDRRQQAHEEDIARDKQKLDLLMAAIASPNFNAEHMPEVMAQMDEINANMGKPKKRSAGGGKPGIFSQILGSLGDVTAVGGTGPQPSQPLPAGTFYTPDQMQQRKLDELQKTTDIQNAAQIKLEQTRQQRPTPWKTKVQYQDLPLGTVDIKTGQPVEPPAQGETKTYSLRQAGHDQNGYPIYEALGEAPDTKPNAQMGTLVPNPTSVTGFSKVVRDQVGNVLQTLDAMPPGWALKTKHEGFITYIDENQVEHIVPVTTTTSKELPGELPQVPSGPGVQVGEQTTIGKTGATSGTWSFAVDGNGDPIQINSKTGDTRPSPGGAQSATAEAAQMKWVQYTDPKTGRVVAGSVAQAKKAGGEDMAALGAVDVTSIQEARRGVKLLTQTGPKPEQQGVLQLIDGLDKAGKLGVAASRINSWLAGGVGTSPGDDPRIITLLDKAALAMTLTMKAHFGTSGGRSPQMLQHFLDMANAKKMDATTLRAGFKAIENYLEDRALLQESPTGAGASSNPATTSKGSNVSQMTDEQLWKIINGGK